MSSPSLPASWRLDKGNLANHSSAPDRLATPPDSASKRLLPKQLYDFRLKDISTLRSLARMTRFMNGLLGHQTRLRRGVARFATQEMSRLGGRAGGVGRLTRSMGAKVRKALHCLPRSTRRSVISKLRMWWWSRLARASEKLAPALQPKLYRIVGEASAPLPIAP